MLEKKNNIQELRYLSNLQAFPPFHQISTGTFVGNLQEISICNLNLQEISELTLNLAGKMFLSLQRHSDHIHFQGTEDIHSWIVPRPKTLGCVWYFIWRISWNCTAVNAWNTARLLLWHLATNMVPLFQTKPVANNHSGYYNWLTTCETRGKMSYSFTKQRFIKWHRKCVACVVNGKESLTSRLRARESNRPLSINKS